MKVGVGVDADTDARADGAVAAPVGVRCCNGGHNGNNAGECYNTNARDYACDRKNNADNICADAKDGR